jgi:acetyltransferase
MPVIATVSNPLDVTGQVVADPELWTNCAAAIADDPGIDVTVSILSILAGHADRKLADDLIAGSGDVLKVAVWASAAPPGCGIELLRAAGIPTFMGTVDAVAAVAAWRRYWDTREARIERTTAPEPTPDATRDPWALLEAAGIPIARHALVTDRAGLGSALAGLRYPLALKIQSDDIPHKTELNLLRLGVKARADAEVAFETLMADARRHRPDAVINGVLVQEMFGGRRELILGIRHEPMLGPAVVFGLGGIFSEVMRDISVRMAPVSGFDVAEMIAELRGSALLGPVRGLGAVRKGLLDDVIQRFSALVLRHGEMLAEFEINPLILADDGQSCAAVDVMVGRQPTGVVA